MGHQYNTIPSEEYLTRLNAVLPIFERGIQGKAEVTELFFLYNDRLTPRKQDKHCGKCVRYIINRMTEYAKQLNGC